MSNKITAAYIAEHHPKVKKLMLQRQVEQGNKEDWGAFDLLSAACYQGGFDWGRTPEWVGVWHEALIKGNFTPLYALHPEWEEKKEPQPLIEGEWYFVKQYAHSAWKPLIYSNGFFVLVDKGPTPAIVGEHIHAIHPEPIKKPE